MVMIKEENFKKFDKSQRSTFSYWYNHWKAFNQVAKELGVWKFHHLFHDLEKPFLRLFMKYEKLQKFHRTHNRHHLEYPGDRNWTDMYVDWECSRYTKVACPRNAIEEANYQLANGKMTYPDYCEFMKEAHHINSLNK